MRLPDDTKRCGSANPEKNNKILQNDIDNLNNAVILKATIRYPCYPIRFVRLSQPPSRIRQNEEKKIGQKSTANQEWPDIKIEAFFVTGWKQRVNAIELIVRWCM